MEQCRQGRGSDRSACRCPGLALGHLSDRQQQADYPHSIYRAPQITARNPGGNPIMSSVTADHIPASEAHQEHGPQKGWRRWVFATNHKDIGTMYLLFSFIMFLEGGVLALLVRT